MRHARTLSRFLLVVALMLIGGADAFIAAARASDEEELKKYWRYFEMTVAFSAEGKEFQERAVFGCHPYYSRRVEKTYLQFNIDVPWLAVRLPSGAGLLFGVPARLCLKELARVGLESTGELRYRTPFPSGYLPPVLWLDNADNPTVIEAYVAETYYGGPSPRLRVRDVAVRPVATGPIADQSKRVGWLASKGKEASFAGFYATVVPRSEWERYPAIRAIVSKFDHLTMLSNEQHKIVSEIFWPLYLGHTVDPYAIVPTDRQIPDYGHSEHEAISRRLSFAMIPRGDILEIDRNRPGVIVHYRNLKFSKYVNASLEDSLVGAIGILVWHYDPNSGALIAVAPSTLDPCPICVINGR
jgi:hypothetical protein